MKQKRTLLILLFFLLVATWHTEALTKNMRQQSKIKEVTLFSRLKYQEPAYGRSAFNFKHKMRSDNEHWLDTTHNQQDILYGNMSFTGDSDWFEVSGGGTNPNRIKDLGALQWSEIQAIPVLLAIPRPTTGIRMPGKGESLEESSDERVTKVVLGHIYLAHIKREDADFYVMFRVDALQPSDNCTISWKLVPSPEK
jgi:hypothetical protein